MLLWAVWGRRGPVQPLSPGELRGKGWRLAAIAASCELGVEPPPHSGSRFYEAPWQIRQVTQGREKKNGDDHFVLEMIAIVGFHFKRTNGILSRDSMGEWPTSTRAKPFAWAWLIDGQDPSGVYMKTCGSEWKLTFRDVMGMGGSMEALGAGGIDLDNCDQMFL